MGYSVTVEGYIDFRTQNYMNVLLACLTAYSWILDLDREVVLIWSRRQSNLSKLLYGILRYGGLILSITGIPTDTGSVKSCSVIVVLDYFLLHTAIFLVLNAMMGMRIYALYERSTRVLLFVGALFTAVQATNIVLTFMALLPLKEAVIAVETPPQGIWCAYSVSKRQAWYQAIAYFGLVIYEFTLFIMSLVCLVRHLREQRRNLRAVLGTFIGIVIRDNVIYFFIAFSGLFLSTCSFLFTSHYPTLTFDIAFNTVAVDLATGVQLTILGPLMMLSIREYDVVQEKGGTSVEFEMMTLEFARLSAPLYISEV